jgi:endonuclease/exonuclease/phosphatase family metal-dependent hydrolase
VVTYNVENYILQPRGSRPVKPLAARERIVTSLKSIDADMIALQEIGGEEALMELRGRLQEKGLNYPYWDLATGFDTNIQVALLSRHPIVARRSHSRDRYLLEGRRFRVSRGFVEVDIQVKPEYRLTLFVAHLKSRRPVAYADEAAMRYQEALLLREKVTARLQVDPEINLMVLGDFNDLKSSPALRAMLGRGKTALIDVRPAERNGDNKPHPNPRYDPRNITWTHYYGKEDSYSRIDYILISPGLAREWIPDQTFVSALPHWGEASDHRPVTAGFAAQNQ